MGSIQHPGLGRMGQVGPDRHGPPSFDGYFVGAQDFKGILVPALHQGG